MKATRVGKVAGDVFLRRPEVDWEVMTTHEPKLAEIEASAALQCLYDIKYEGYIQRKKMEVEKQQRLAGKRIPPTFDYMEIPSLRNEAKEKLCKVRPLSLGQAKRISGITPADLALVLAYLEAK